MAFVYILAFAWQDNHPLCINFFYLGLHRFFKVALSCDDNSISAFQIIVKCVKCGDHSFPVSVYMNPQRVLYLYIKSN